MERAHLQIMQRNGVLIARLISDDLLNLREELTGNFSDYIRNKIKEDISHRSEDLNGVALENRLRLKVIEGGKCQALAPAIPVLTPK